jgi:hypothetical protein
MPIITPEEGGKIEEEPPLTSVEGAEGGDYRIGVRRCSYII